MASNQISIPPCEPGAMGELLQHPTARREALRQRLLLLCDRLERAGRLVLAVQTRQLSDAVEAGHIVLELKALTPHGKWMTWARKNLPGVSHRSLNIYARLAREEGKFAASANSIVEALDLIAKAQLAEKRKALTDHPPALPPGKFSVIAADPPWPLDERGTQLPYNSMSLDEIRALPVASRAAEDSVLWLWAVDAFLPEALGVMDAWGFTYARRTMAWLKPNLAPHPWMQGGHELLLIGTRGSPTIIPAGYSTVLRGPRRAHSQKPDDFFEMAEAMCPARPEHRLELFAREARPGWSGWGDQLRVGPSGRGGGAVAMDSAAARPA